MVTQRLLGNLPIGSLFEQNMKGGVSIDADSWPQSRVCTLDAVGSSQIFFPTQNLERTY